MVSWGAFYFRRHSSKIFVLKTFKKLDQFPVSQAIYCHEACLRVGPNRENDNSNLMNCQIKLGDFSSPTTGPIGNINHCSFHLVPDI